MSCYHTVVENKNQGDLKVIVKLNFTKYDKVYLCNK